MEPQPPHDAPLSLSKLHLHIENVLPSASLPLYEAKQSTTGSRRSSVTQQVNHEDDSESEQRHDREWMHQQLTDRMSWMTSFKPNKKGGLIFLDQEALKKQQGVVKEVMRQVGSQLLTGKLALRISLPIRIFEPRTLLERVADGWNYAPSLLKKAAQATDPLERLKFVMAFVVGGIHFCVGQHKPFNPILGETYEATYPDGTQIFMEHVAHHPVQSAFQVCGPNGLYELSGAYEFETVSSRNSIYNHQIGKTTIRFHDNHSITYTLPQIKMTGVLLGERVVEIGGVAKFEDHANALTGEIKFGANGGGLLFGKSQADDIKGHIVSSTKKGPKASHTIQVQGSWLTHLQVDGKVYWQVDSEPVFQHQPVENPLPSDCRFREDLIALKQGNLALAQFEKVRLEEVQRIDDKLRDRPHKTPKRRATKW